MKVEDFDYTLPEERIAFYPPKIRGSSKLLVLNKTTGVIKHRRYSDMLDYLTPGDVVVLNDTKVIKARLIAKNEKGKNRELLLLEQHGHSFGVHTHKVLHRGKIHENEQLNIGDIKLRVKKLHGGGIATITSTANLLSISDRYGNVPLPPYINRGADRQDEQRYQTVFARQPGSVAAPTASLNFTEELAAKLKDKGIKVVYLTLHVGLGTFLPIRVDDVAKHKMHSEYFEIPKETVEAIQNAKKVTAIGTTVARTLEYCADKILQQKAQDLSGEADIFIYGEYTFKIVDKLVTNFHAPRTTVLMLAAAFAGKDNLVGAYQAALEKDYKFLSYGDSMLIL